MAQSTQLPAGASVGQLLLFMSIGVLGISSPSGPAIVPCGDTCWTSEFSSGPDDHVLALLYSEGLLYVGGHFTTITPTSSPWESPHLAVWDGDSWLEVGGGTNGSVYVLALAPNGTLYAGGDFSSAGGLPAANIAAWTGTAWEPLGDGVNNLVYGLVPDGDGGLYVGGDFTTAGGAPANHVAHWDGSAWTPLEQGTNNAGTIYAMALDGSGNLYVGGEIALAGDVPVGNVAMWNGMTWSALGEGVGSVVEALAAAASGALYATGDFSTAGSIGVNDIARWDGVSWSALGMPPDDGLAGEGGDALALDGEGRLYVTGSFDQAGTTGAESIALWDGLDWHALGSGLNNGGKALALDPVRGGIFVGGLFTQAGGRIAPRIAHWVWPVFVDDFESGDVTAWSRAVP